MRLPATTRVFSRCLSSLVDDPCRVSRHFAGGSCASRRASRAAVAASTHSLSPQQLGEGEALDEDVAREVERIGQGGGDGDAVKVTAATGVVAWCFNGFLLIRVLRGERSCRWCRGWDVPGGSVQIVPE